MNRLIYLLPIIWSAVALRANAQDLQQAEEDYKAFVKSSLNQQTSAENYEKLYAACDVFRQVLLSSPKEIAEHKHSRDLLLTGFNFLGEAAVYFTEIDDEANTIRFATAFVNISMMDEIYNEEICSRQGYAQFPFFLADRAASEHRYEDAIPYYQTYLQTGDRNMCEDAYEQLISCYYKLKDYDNAVSMASRAIKQFPENLNMATLGINACIEGHRDNELQPFLNMAKQLNPAKEGLMEIQAGLYERQRDYDKAVELYLQIFRDKPESIVNTCHLGVNYYNCGVTLLEEAQILPNEGDAKPLTDRAKECFREAMPYLKDVIARNPYNPNMVRALAQCHNVLGDEPSLQQENKNLEDMHVRPVKMGDNPSLLTNYNWKAIALEQFKSTTLSDIDNDIPEVAKPNSNTTTYAIIIGNENYRHIGSVSYAHNDANSFAEYCRRILGVPNRNISLLQDATKSEMERYFEGVGERARMQPGKLRFIIYYAGHGLPNVTQGTSYLVPSDADSDIASCCSLNDLYEQLNKVDALGITVFLDACFSGASRNGGSVLDDRFFYINDISTKVEGKTVAFCAASDKETALPYNEQFHGLFTYVLLKSLKETKGNITYGQLAERLKIEVDQLAYDTKNKHQTPRVMVSDAITESWKEQTLLK